MNSAYRHTTGFSRREILQVGYSGLLGMGLSALPVCASPATPQAARKRKSVILVFLSGGPSQLDTFDMKPDAPAEIRGEFKPIATRVPGLTICEHLPRLAARADKYALVRSLSYRETEHNAATHHLLTGQRYPGGNAAASRNDWPCYSSALSYLEPRHDGIPSGVHLPASMLGGGVVVPGQHAGFLAPRHDPLQVTANPNAPGFRVDGLRLDPQIGVERLGDRRTLMTHIDGQRETLARTAEGQRLSDQQQQAFSILTSGKIAQAFDLGREPAAVRNLYGRHTFGQSLLLARRLVQTGVPVVQVNMGSVLDWDTHTNNFSKLKQQLLPPMDQGVAVLLDDLEASGLLDDTLVLLLGEFGRTPRIGVTAGREHWPACFFGLFAGAGVRGGQLIGSSDSIGAYPSTTPYSPNDVGATVYHILGVDPATEVHDRQGRPTQLNRGQVIQSLFTGAQA